MEFCSKYGYNYGFEGSDSEEYSDEDEKSKQKIKKKIRKADTNIIAVKFDQLVSSNEMFAGEPKSCKKCGAIMSFLSEKNTIKENDKFIWTCEFCMEKNDMTNMIDDLNEIPKKDDVTFMLELPKQKEAKGAAASADAKQVSNDDSYLGFCIDISGSMDTNIPVKDNVAADRRRNFTRLSGVKVACMETLKKLKDEEPNKRVALITFSDIVKYYGDCTKINNNSPLLSIGGGEGGHMAYQQNAFLQQQVRTTSTFTKIRNFFSKSSSNNNNSTNNSGSDDETLNNNNNNNNNNNTNNNIIQSSPQDLNNKEKILAYANNLSGELKGIGQSHSAVEGRMKNLNTEGSTALGPALLFSVGFAAKKPGSSIILCTDGCANVGLGSIETNPGDETQKFYDDIADFAKEKGVVVNVFSMEGTDCKLALLGRVADRSNGTMSIVNPLNLSEEFASILQNRIVATNVVAKLIVNHKYLYIRDEKLDAEEGKAIDTGDEKAKKELESKKESIVARNIGNANIDTEITFEYGIRKLENKNEKKEDLKEMPFQLQVTYTAQDGSKAIRVYTKILEFTTNRQEAEKNLQAEDIIFAHNAQMMSNQVLKCNVAASKYRGEAVDRLLLRNQMMAPNVYSEYSSKVQHFSKEKKAIEMDDTEAEEAFYQAKMSRSKLKKPK